MTILDNDRVVPNYREAVAKAMLKVRYYDGEERFYDGLDGFYRDLNPDHWFNALAEADAAILALRKLGAFHHESLADIKAEERLRAAQIVERTEG